jgi:hypothetical protein
MKRLLSAALALSLLSGTAAIAGPFGPGSGHHDRYDRGWDRHHGRYHGDGAGTAFAVGFGLLALTAILASSNRGQARERDYGNAPPPNGPDYGPNNGPNNGPNYGPDYGPNNRQAPNYGPNNGSNNGQGYDNDRNDGPDNQGQPSYDNNRPYGPDRQ